MLNKWTLYWRNFRNFRTQIFCLYNSILASFTILLPALNINDPNFLLCTELRHLCLLENWGKLRSYGHQECGLEMPLSWYYLKFDWNDHKCHNKSENGRHTTAFAGLSSIISYISSMFTRVSLSVPKNILLHLTLSLWASKNVNTLVSLANTCNEHPGTFPKINPAGHYMFKVIKKTLEQGVKYVHSGVFC